MTATPGMLSLGDEENLWDAGWTGWAYPQRRERLALLENTVGSTGNAVVQESSIGFRLGQLSFTAQDRTQRDVIRGYDEAATQVTFTDEDGSTCTVLVNDYGASWKSGDLWDLSVELIQLTEPAVAGS